MRLPLTKRNNTHMQQRQRILNSNSINKMRKRPLAHVPPPRHAGRGHMGAQHRCACDGREARPVGARTGAVGVAGGMRLLRSTARGHRAAVRPLCSLLRSTCELMLACDRACPLVPAELCL